MTNGLTREQRTAIKKALEVGLLLQKDFPGLANDYRNCMFTSEIISKYDLTSKYRITKQIAINSIYRALRGNRETRFEVGSYDGLLGEEEIERLRMKHFSRSGYKSGINSYKNKLGVHARTKEQRIRDGRKGGNISGRKNLEMKIGIHALTQEQRIEYGRASAISRGEVLWKPQEIESAYILSQLGYQHKLIAEGLNEFIHNGRKVRTASSVESYLWKYKKNLYNDKGKIGREINRNMPQLQK